MASSQDYSVELEAIQPRGRTAIVLRAAVSELRKNPNMAYGALVVLLMVFIGIAAPVLFTQDPQKLTPLDKFISPSGQYWFGTDHLGRDVYSRVLYGSRISLTVAGSVAASATIVGIVLGLISGYNYRLDAVIMRVVDGLMTIPTILLGMAFMAMLGGSMQNIIIALTITQSPVMARVVRSSTLELKREQYVDAATAMGASPIRIIFRHILPNAFAPIIVQATFVAAAAVLIESALSFLGAGIPPRIPSWGGMISLSTNYLSTAPWNIIFPGAFLTFTVLGISLLGDGIRDVLDPTLRRRG